MKTNYLFAGLLLLMSLPVIAQFEQDYKPLQCSGTLPDDFITATSRKYLNEKKAMSKGKSRKKKAQDHFIQESNYETDNMLLGGRALVNDPLTTYVNHVADKVLESDPDTRHKLRFYVLRSSYVNASATNQGAIFVNMGMLAQLENEAQLAYILCHEITHYKKKHMMNRALERDRIERGEDAYKGLTKDEQLLATRAFSRENETEADVEGLELLKKSGYSTNHLIGAFDVLKYAYLPFDDVVFDPSWLETPAYHIPDGFRLKATSEINIGDKAENLKSTHPSVKARKELIQDKILKAEADTKPDYLIGKEQFETARTMARFELSRIYILRHQYEDALYNSYLLLKKYPNNLYLKKTALEALEGLATYAASSDFLAVHTSWLSIEGHKQALHYMIGQMDSASQRDVITLAMVYAVKLKEQYPNDEDIAAHTRFILHLMSRQEINMDYFAKELPQPGAVSVSPVIDSTASKYDKLREQERVKAERQRSYYTRYALVGYTDRKWLQDMYAEAFLSRSSENDADRVAFSRKSKVSTREYALGVDRVLIVDPYYSRMDVSKKKKITVLQADAGRIKFKNCIKQCARVSKLDVEILDARTLTSGDADKLNDISLLEEFNAERQLHKDVDGIFPEHERLAQIAQKYNTDYIMWSGVTSYKQYDHRKGFLACISATMPVILPFTITTLVNAGQYTLYYNMVYDVKHDVLRMANYREVNARTSQNVLNSHIYDTFSQIHRKPAPAAADQTDKPKAKRK